MADKTVIMIAHRMQTVRNADIICVIKDGQIIEKGNHDELMALNGNYKRMVDEYDKAVTWKIGRKEISNA